jgi:hypothetical protein
LSVFFSWFLNPFPTCMCDRSPFETTSLLTDDIASPLSSPVCSPPGGQPMLCGARQTSRLACNSLSRVQIPHANSPCCDRTSRGAFRFRCVLRCCVSPLFLNLLSPDGGPDFTLGCAPPFHLPLLASLQSMRLSPPRFANTSLLAFVRCIVLILSGALVRRKTSCGCMRYVAGSAKRSSRVR